MEMALCWGHLLIFIPFVEYTEPEIINRCQKRDRKAQYVFYKHHYGYLFSICLRYCYEREEARGMVNLAFAKIMLNLKKYDRSRPLKAWIRQITVNCILDELRKTKSYKEVIAVGSENPQVINASDNNYTNMGSNLTEVIQRKLGELHPVTRSVFNLYAIDGYKHREIGEMLGISEGTSAWHYSEAKKKVRAYLEPEFPNLKKNGRATA